MQEKRIAKENKYGKHSNLILIGENDRIGRNARVLFDDELMKKSYSYGFYERGSRVLEGKIAYDLTLEKNINFTYFILTKKNSFNKHK